MQTELELDEFAHVEHLRQVIAGRMAPPVRGGERVAALSVREREVWCLLAKGAMNNEIARALEISPQTVKNHVTAVVLTLGVANRTAAGTLYGAVFGVAPTEAKG